MIQQATSGLKGLSIPKKPTARQEDLESSSSSYREGEDVIRYKVGTGEDLSFVENESVDLITGGVYICTGDVIMLWIDPFGRPGDPLVRLFSALERDG
jgi:hypothetical protein